MKLIPKGTTHFCETYGEFIFYKMKEVTYVNSVIDHPTECFQLLQKWYYFDLDQWESVGEGFNSRRLKSINHINDYFSTEEIV